MTDSQQIDALLALSAILGGSQRPKLAHIPLLELIAVGTLHDELSDDLLVGPRGLGVWMWIGQPNGWWRDVGNSDDRDRDPRGTDSGGSSRAVVAPSPAERTGERCDDPAQSAESEDDSRAAGHVGGRSRFGGADCVSAERGIDDLPTQHVAPCHCSTWASAMNAAEPSVRAGLRRALSDVAVARSILATSLRGGSDTRGPFCYVVGAGRPNSGMTAPCMAWSGRAPGAAKRMRRLCTYHPGAIRSAISNKVLAMPGSHVNALAEPRCGLCGGLLGARGADLSLAAEIAAHPVFGLKHG